MQMKVALRLLPLALSFTVPVLAADKPADAPSPAAAAPAAPAAGDDLQRQLADAKDQLATSLRSYTVLMDENAQLKQAADKSASDIASLTAQLASAREIVRTFLGSFPAMLHDLSRGNVERSRRAAHGLKSSARQLGAHALSERMAALEARLSTPGQKVTPEDLAGAARDFADAAATLRKFAGR
jgi:HPt (histidine-containing phosphotransfer) domain-containing protein